MPEPYPSFCVQCHWKGTSDELVDAVTKFSAKIKVCPNKCESPAYIERDKSGMPGPDAGGWADMLRKKP